jgi:hypothetical protein
MGEMTAQQMARQRLANLGLDAFAPKPSTDKRLRENRANVRKASRKYSTPKTLAEFGLNRPPQSWCYTEVDV